MKFSLYKVVEPDAEEPDSEVAADESPAAAAEPSPLSDEDVDRIARRVLELRLHF